ncbi:MAG: hypothetical protein HRF43_09095 [Phycisphaerae bacterium]|jgi:hypothetical protein
MRRDPIEQLLRQADRRAGRPPVCDHLAGRVRRLAQRRRRHRGLMLAAAACLALIAAPALHRGLMGRTGPQVVAAPGEARIEEQLDRLHLDVLLLLADLAAESPWQEDASEPAAAAPVTAEFAFEPIQEQLEQAAFLAVYQGDRYNRELNRPESAVASYQDTIRFFPGTRAAATARARLEELHDERGRT